MCATLMAPPPSYLCMALGEELTKQQLPPCVAGLLIITALVAVFVHRARQSKHTIMGQLVPPGVGPHTTLLLTGVCA